MHLSTPVTRCACPWGHHYGYWKASPDVHALGDTIMVIGRRHDGRCPWLGRVNSIGLQRDSRHGGLTDKHGNLLTMLDGYWLAGIGLAPHRTRHFQARHPAQHGHRWGHPVYMLIRNARMFSFESWPSTLDSLPSIERQADRVSKPLDGAVSPGFLQLRSGQLSWTLTSNRIGLQ